MSAPTPSRPAGLSPGMPPGLDSIGQRLTLRIHDPAGGFRDIMGILESETSIRKRDGSLIHFTPASVAIWRVIVPPLDQAGKGAPLSLRILEIEFAANATWPAKEQVQLGDWILRASGKFTKRANSALALGNPGMNIDAAIEKVRKFYNSRKMTPVIHIALPTYSVLGSTLKKQGWRRDLCVNVMVADIEEVLALFQSVDGWEIHNDPIEEWVALQNNEGVLEIMRRFPARYAGLRVDGEFVAAGRAANDGKWTVLTRLFVRPDRRGRGYGVDLVVCLLKDARELGATKAALQVDSNNVGAIALYEKLGFRLHHTYEYFSYQPPSNLTGGC